MDMQKIFTLASFGIREDPREHFVKSATLRFYKRVKLSGNTKVLQTFEVVQGLRGPLISILGLIKILAESHVAFDLGHKIYIR